MVQETTYLGTTFNNSGSQIPVYGLAGRGLGGRSAAPGAGFCGQNLGIKYIPCVAQVPIYE